jgi:hypothetical protein
MVGDASTAVVPIVSKSTIFVRAALLAMMLPKT